MGKITGIIAKKEEGLEKAIEIANAADAKIIIIQYPEIALLPLEQISLMDNLRKIANERNFDIILITLSPYIIAGCDEIYEDRENKIEKAETPLQFIKADILILQRKIKSESESE